MTLRERQAHFQDAMAHLIIFAWDRGTPIVITELYRTKERQATLVAKGLSKTMKSKHIDGLAFDMVFLDDLADGDVDAEWSQYEELGKEWERLGGAWGGRWKNFPDAMHFEWTRWEEK